MDALAIAIETTNALIAAGAALLGVVIGSIVTFGVALVQSRQARAEREVAATSDRRARAAAILGRARVFLTDIHPDRVAFNVNKEITPKQFESLAARLNVLRDEISIFAANEQDPRETGDAAKLEVAMFNAFNSASQLAGDLLANRDAKDAREAAKRAHLKANVYLRIVLDRVHGRDVAELHASLQTLDKIAVGDIEGALEDLDHIKPGQSLAST